MLRIFLYLLNKCKNDLIIDYNKNRYYDIIICDFIGWDANNEEVYRDLDEPETIEHFLKWLEKESLFVKNDTLYRYYYFKNFIVSIGYSSFYI